MSGTRVPWWAVALGGIAGSLVATTWEYKTTGGLTTSTVSFNLFVAMAVAVALALIVKYVSK